MRAKPLHRLRSKAAKKKRSHEEDDICVAFIEHVEAHSCRPVDPPRRDLLFHIPNGGKRSKREGALFQRMGVLVGVSDYFYMSGRSGYAGLWIEVKKPSETNVRKSQREFICNAREQGYAAAVAYGLDELLMIFYAYNDCRAAEIERELNTISKAERKRWASAFE